MSAIHPTAVVEAGAALGEGVTIGPFCLVGADVRLGDGVVLDGHCVVTGRTELGRGCRVYPFASVGTAPQDMKYAGEESWLTVGAETTIREHATLNPGTAGGGRHTRVGARCLLMVGAHVAHDCQVGDDVIMVNQATLGGHVTIEDGAILGGLAAVHQYVRIGAGAMIGGMTGVENDVIPYGMALGNRARLNGINVVGLKRRGVHKSAIQTLRNAYHVLFERDDGTFQARIAEVAERYGHDARVAHVLDFLRADAGRALCRPAGAADHGG
jgi:UDP-N-acetylglucosamine acyltransferase